MVSIRSMMFALAAAPIMVAAGAAWAEAPYGAVDHTATEAEQTIHVRVTRPGESAVSKTLEIDVNKTAILEFEQDVDDILVANPGIADVLARSKRRIAVMGRGKGESGIIFLDKNGNEVLSLDVIVAAQGVTELQGLINRLVPESSIHAEFVNGAIVLTGQAKSLADADTAIQLSQQFVEKNNPVLNMVSIEGKDQVLLKVRIVEMQRSVVKQLGVNLSGNLNVGEFASQTVGQIFDAAGLPIYDEAGNLLEGLVSAPPWDQTTSIATANTFGLSGGSLGGLSASTGYQNYVGGQLQSSAGVTLDALERVGLLRTLAEPNLTALSGENAKFLAGGEFPVPNGTDDEGNISLAFKPFGVGLGFTPVVLSAGRISMRISTEVSEMTNEGGFQAGGQVVVDSSGNTFTTPAIVVPAVTTRRVDTTVELPSGGSLVVAGLIKEETRQAMDSIPGVGNMPILGALFRSREFQNDETELVVIVTPYLVEPTDPNKLRAPDDGYVTPRDARAMLFGKLNEVYGVEGHTAKPTGPVGAGFIVD